LRKQGAEIQPALTLLRSHLPVLWANNCMERRAPDTHYMSQNLTEGCSESHEGILPARVVPLGQHTGEKCVWEVILASLRKLVAAP